MRAMRISLVIPTAYTEEPYFSRCMKRVYEESINKDVEVIISEDGLIPDSMKQFYPSNAIILNHSEPSGCGLARKRAIEISTGDIICFLDSDDLLCRGWYDTIIDNGPNTEYYFINVEPNGKELLIDTLDVKYGHFSHEMVWNKAYDGPSLRECISKYNPLLMMTPAEDLLMNCVYLGENKVSFKQITHTILKRYVRNSGLAMSTAKDDRNRLKQVNVSLEYMKNNPRNEDIFLWTSTYAHTIEERAKQQKHISGFKWFGGYKVGSVNEWLVIKLFDNCNRHCDYCANILYDNSIPINSEDTALKTMDALDRFNNLYKLPNAIVITGGEPTLCNPLDFLEIFNKYDKHTFIVYTNGLDLDNWIKNTPDNVLFKLHLVDETIPIKYIDNERIISMIVISNDEKVKNNICKINLPKLKYVLDHQYKEINPTQIEDCRQCVGPYVIDLARNIVYPCCGTNCKISGTIENLPNKLDNKHCSSCKNPCDNYIEVW